MTDLLVNLQLLADDAGKGAEQGGGNPFISFVPLILVVVLFYFMILGPQRRQQKQHEDLVDKLKKNDEVLTRGGIFGKVVSVGDEGKVVIRIDDNARMTVHKNAIAQVLNGETGEANDKS